MILAEKFGHIIAMQGTLGETVVSWSTDDTEKPVIEKAAKGTAEDESVRGR